MIISSSIDCLDQYELKKKNPKSYKGYGLSHSIK